MQTTANPTLGFIGLGLMGGPMAANMLKAGSVLTVWNRSADKCEMARSRGAIVAASPKSLAQTSDIVFTCLLNRAALEDVLFGPQGISKGAREGSLLVDHSTLDPQSTKELAARLFEECGMRWVDAPVSGGVSGAKEGTLVIFAGGEEQDIATVARVAKPMCARIEAMGELGFGQFGKLCNQILVGCNRLAVAEMLALAERMGFDSARLPEILGGALGDSQVLQKDGPYMIKRDYQPRGRCQIMIKDMTAVLKLAETYGVDMAVAQKAHEVLQTHAGRGFMDADCASVMEYYLASDTTVGTDEGAAD